MNPITELRPTDGSDRAELSRNRPPHRVMVGHLANGRGEYQMNGNMIGQRFGMWVVIEAIAKKTTKYTEWLCLCDCGNIKAVRSYSLMSGHSKSCGCIRSAAVSSRNFKHGLTHSPGYAAWKDMISRCYNKKNKSYPYYGGRGISVCREWRHSPVQFFADMGTKPFEGAEIDRIENNGNYCPSNCQWATRTQNNRNTRTTIFICFRGETRCLSEWSELFGISRGAISQRLRLGWTIERAITEPTRKRRTLCTEL
jgi:hypothetical protein